MDEWRLADVGGGYYGFNSGRTLDVSGASTTAGARRIQYTSRGSADQEWQLVDVGGGYVQIVSRNSGMVVDVEDNTTTDGASVIQWPWSSGANQQWQLVQVGSVPFQSGALFLRAAPGIRPTGSPRARLRRRRGR